MLSIYLAALDSDLDRERFTLLYETYEKRLYAVALHILKNPVQAEDAAQQSWLQILRHWDRVRALSPEEAGGYIITTAKNTALSFLRQEHWNASMPENWEPSSPGAHDSDYQCLVELIRSMPEGYRRILELKFVEEQSNQAIAGLLGLNVSTVSTKIHRGRALLLEALRKEGYFFDGQNL